MPIRCIKKILQADETSRKQFGSLIKGICTFSSVCHNLLKKCQPRKGIFTLTKEINTMLPIPAKNKK